MAAGVSAVEKDKILFLHTPKAGGGAMEKFLYGQLRTVRRNYFLSFNGKDDSLFAPGEDSTPRPDANKCVIERIFETPSLADEFANSPHFQQAKLIFGHATFSLPELFPRYRFRHLLVVREPIERTISNIAQFSPQGASDVLKFGAYYTRAEKYSAAYWDFLYDILTKEYPVEDLLIHENLYLRNCMTHILQGSRYLDVHEPANLHLAWANAMRAEVSFYDDFNAGLQRSFDALGVPVNMAQNAWPGVSKAKQRHGRYLNAPPKVVEFVADHNETDRRLYDLLRSRRAQASA